MSACRFVWGLLYEIYKDWLDHVFKFFIVKEVGKWWDYKIDVVEGGNPRKWHAEREAEGG